MKIFFPANLKYLRKKKAISQGELALQLNKAHTSIGNWEKGLSEPSLAEIAFIASLFEIEMNELLTIDLANLELIDDSSKNQTKKISDIGESPPTYQQARLANMLSAEKKKTIPFYDISAIGGNTTSDMQPVIEPTGTIDVGDLLSDSEAALRIFGNSMLPNYPSGSVVGLIRQTGSFIIPGEVYVLETKDSRLLKRLFYKDDNPSSEYISCLSDNTMLFDSGPRKGMFAYPLFDVPKNEIIALHIVTGVIKRNINSLIITKN